MVFNDRKLKKCLGLFFKKYHILILLFIGSIPILWYKRGYFIAKGDHFPYVFRIGNVNSDFYLWLPNNLGNPSALSAFILYDFLGAFLQVLSKDIGLWQIIVHTIYFIGAVFSMFYLSKTIYPEQKLTAIVASIFYVFNIVTLLILLNIGLMWAYAFLPLLIALFMKILTKSKNVFKHIIFFVFTFTIVASISSINLACVALIIINLAWVLFYYAVFERKIAAKQFIKNLTILSVTTFLLNIWWAIPIINYYLLSSTMQLHQEVNVLSMSWTHSRASILNLFWLNGGWAWRPEYFPYYDSYSNNAFLTFMLFAPSILAFASLLFKSGKQKFNTYIALLILLFIFLAKGLHDPFSQLNLLLYIYIPSMAMFREPTSKFTMALMPFLALLVGYAVDHIANIKIGKIKSTNIMRTVIASFFITILIIPAYPLVTNPIETKTQQLPFSSYVRIPDYWHQAADWLDNQHGDYKILITPPDDFYQMPYTWGYYGADQFLERIIQKPIISNHYKYFYKINPDISLTLQQLYSTIKYNRTTEFKVFFDLLNIKYILQRNDIQHNLTGRNIIPPNEMQTFLTQQPYLRLTKKFGQLDIYEYDESKPYLYILSPTTLKQTIIKIENITTLENSWNFTSLKDIQEWQNATQPDQWQINYTITQDEHTLKAELWNSTKGWKLINSPIFPAQYGDTYQIQADIKGQDAHQIHIKMVEYDINQEILISNYLEFANDGTFNWAHTIFNFEPTNKTTKYLQMQVWHGHETDKPFPNIIWVDSVKIHGYTTRLNTTGVNLIFQNSTQNQPAAILDYQKINPTKITATINATQPFILAISEALDQSWKAYVNGKQIENTPLYLGLKGFHINQTGLLEITIEYEPQKWFYYGSIISVATLLACLTYLTYNWIKNKAFWKRIETILRAR